VRKGRSPVLGPTASRVFGCRLPDRLLRKLEELARASGENPSVIVRALIDAAPVCPGPGNGNAPGGEPRGVNGVGAASTGMTEYPALEDTNGKLTISSD
jgi:hypothetical protein